MAVKLRPFAISSKISTWVFSFKSISSVSSAISSQNCPESPQKRPKNTEIDPRVQYLKNNLCPDELIRVLDRTHDLRSALKVFKWASLQRNFRHTCDTYSRVILKLGFAGNVDEMEGFCREMVNDGCQGVEHAFGHLLDEFVAKGRLDETVRVLLVMNSCGYSKISVPKWNSVLGALVEGRRDFRDVLLVYKEMVKSRTVPNVDTLNCLIKALFDANMGDKALDQFRRMERKRCSPNCRTYEIVICGLVGLGRVDESLGLMSDMFERGVDPELGFYKNVIPVLCREDKLEEAKRLFGMMRSSRLQPDACIYEYLIMLLCSHCCFGEATELFCEMRSIGFGPSDDVINGVINAYCELGNLEELRTLLEENGHLLNNPTLCNVLLQCYCDSHNLLDAKELFCKMLLSGLPDSLSWNIIIRANLKQAHKLLGKMIVLSYPPNAATYSALVISKCNLSEYEDAMKLFKQITEKEWILDPDSYAKFVEGLCNVGRFQEAAEVFVYMSRRACSIHCSLFSGLIRGLCTTTKRVNEAIDLLNLGHGCKNPVDISIYTTIMDSLLKQDRPNDALVFFSQILRRGLGLDVEAYCILIQCMVAMCETKSCVLFLNMMMGEGLIPNIETFASLFSYLASRSELDTVWMIINKLSKESEAALDPEMYNMLIHVLWKEGCRTEAGQLLDSMLDKGWVPDANTHALLFGSLHKEAEKQVQEHCSSVLQDEVSCILSEGLGGR